MNGRQIPGPPRRGLCVVGWILAAASVAVALGLSVQSQGRPDYPITPVAFTAVQLNDEFWAPRIEINRASSIPSAFLQCELTGRVALFDRAAAVLRGDNTVDKRPPGYPRCCRRADRCGAVE